MGVKGFLLAEALHRGSVEAGDAGASMPTVKVGVMGQASTAGAAEVKVFVWCTSTRA